VRLLLDTHALLWALDDNERFGPTARGLIADPANDVLVSVVSLWEIAIKLRAGKVKADIKSVSEALGRTGVTLLGIEVAHLSTLAGLPAHHRDPFDHLLIAQAITEGATLMSEDQNMPRYPVQAIGCSG